MIFQEVDANNENISQLIGRIINFSQLEFEQLLACHKAGYSQELSDIQEDLSELKTFVHTSLEKQELESE